MHIIEGVREAVRTLTRPLAPTEVVDRETARSRFYLAILAIVLTTVFFGSTPVHWPLFSVAVLTIAAAGAASLLPACWPTLNRISGMVVLVQVTALVAATGGGDSPYGVLYLMLLIYGTVFYGTRRLAATAVVIGVLFLLPHLSDAGHRTADNWAQLAVQMGVWGVIVAVTHGLVQRTRVQRRASEASEQRYRCLFDQNPDAVFSLDPQGRFTDVNAAVGQILGLDAGELVGASFVPWVAPDELPVVEESFVAAVNGAPQELEVTVVDVTGQRITGVVTAFPILVGGAVIGVHGVFKDISDRKALEEELAHAALHDPLTGLPNRALLQDRLEHAQCDGERTGSPTALLLIDLDGFKTVNDTHGHLAGDALLVEVATRVEGCTRPGDTLARLGGDEFALVLPGADRCVAVEVAQRLLDAISRPTTIDDAKLAVGGSIGIAVSLAATGREQLLRDADAAMYTAKRHGKGRSVVFSPELEGSSGAGPASGLPTRHAVASDLILAGGE